MHLKYLAASLSALIVLSCGGEGDSQSQAGDLRRPSVPDTLWVKGEIPEKAAPTVTAFGGSLLVSVYFQTSLKLDASYPAEYLNWAKFTKQEFQSPTDPSCRPDGLEISYTTQSSLAEIHLWAWDKKDSDACFKWIQEALQIGLSWKLYNVPSFYGGTVLESHIQLKPISEPVLEKRPAEEQP